LRGLPCDAQAAAWLGDAALPTITVEVGFVEDVYLDDGDDRTLDALLASPAAGYVRGATIRGQAKWWRTCSRAWRCDRTDGSSGCRYRRPNRETVPSSPATPRWR
jgi:hypothetical protein